MSSIRDALKRAERERMARSGPQDEAAKEEQSSPPPRRPVEPELPRTQGEEPSAPAEPILSREAQAAPAVRHEEQRESPRDSASDLRLVRTSTIPLIEVPIGFTEELALFRHGVEAAVPKPRRTLIMSSATSGEGVTMLTTFLSTSLAVRDGKKTCLVDANFKSPKTSRIFDLLGRPGLSDYCTGRSEMSEVLGATESPDLFIMGLGTDVYNPSLVLSHERARGLAGELAQRFDYVLFDCGSLLGHAEPSMLAPTVDGVILVVRANRTKREVLAKAEKLVRFSGGTVIGTVLNRRTFPIPEAIYKRL